MDLKPDWSLKRLHVAIQTGISQRSGDEKPVIHGVIFNPSRVFSKLNIQSEHIFAEEFGTGRRFLLAVVETHMGPGELAKVFQNKFGVDCTMYVGGIIAPFVIEEDRVAALFQDLHDKPQDYLKSEEEVIFSI